MFGWAGILNIPEQVWCLTPVNGVLTSLADLTFGRGGHWRYVVCRRSDKTVRKFHALPSCLGKAVLEWLTYSLKCARLP